MGTQDAATVMEQIEDLLDRLDLFEYIYPTNYTVEKQAFFNAYDDGEIYNPQYEYMAFDAEDDARRQVDAIAADVENDLGQRLVDGLRGRIEMIAAIGTDTITETSKAVYGFPDDATIKAATEQHRPPADHNGDAAIDAATARDAFYELFEELGVDYDCKLIDAESNRNDPLNRTIYIGKDITFSPMRAKRMLIHESTHAVRTLNGMKTGEPALVYGVDGYEKAEEGLPTFNEHAVGVFEDTLPKITSRVIAIAHSDLSFHAMYELMREKGLGRRLAFIRTYRIKRGLRDTAQPGGFIKDHIYFEGFSRIKERPELANDLYIGKTGFADVETVQRHVDTETLELVSRDAHLDAYDAVKHHLEQ